MTKENLTVDESEEASGNYVRESNEIKTLIQHAIHKDADSFENQFNSIMAEKMGKAIGAKYDEMFGADSVEESYKKKKMKEEDDDYDDEMDDDDDDMDMDDDDDDDMDDEEIASEMKKMHDKGMSKKEILAKYDYKDKKKLESLYASSCMKR